MATISTHESGPIRSISSTGKISGKTKDAYDDTVRRRLAEIRASGGVPHAQVAMEVLYMIPGEFLRKYQEMFAAALKADGGEAARNRQQQDAAKVGRSQVRGKTGLGPTVQGGGKRYKKSFVVLSDEALALKNRMDKRLRQMAREIERDLAELAGQDHPNASANHDRLGMPAQCFQQTCRMFLQSTWDYCPTCGTRRVKVA